MSDNEVTFDIYKDNNSTYPDCVILRIRQNGHWSSVPVTLAAARIISASMDLYRAVKMDNDFLTPSDEAVKAGMDALDKAEGEPVGTRWHVYLHQKVPKDDNGMNRQLFELPDLPANRDLMNDLLASRPAPTDEKALRGAWKLMLQSLRHALIDIDSIDKLTDLVGAHRYRLLRDEISDAIATADRALLAHEAPEDGSGKT